MSHCMSVMLMLMLHECDVDVGQHRRFDRTVLVSPQGRDVFINFKIIFPHHLWVVQENLNDHQVTFSWLDFQKSLHVLVPEISRPGFANICNEICNKLLDIQ